MGVGHWSYMGVGHWLYEREMGVVLEGEWYIFTLTISLL